MDDSILQGRIGAWRIDPRRFRFRVWAPDAKSVAVRLVGQDSDHPLAREEWGYWSADIEAQPGDRYLFVLDGADSRPDPASRHQPDGVHEASAVVDCDAFAWSDADWRAPSLAEWILYELHVGTFTDEGTFDAAIARLPALADLGVNAIEIMPVAAFPGARNWGYDGVYPFAVQESYGGPRGLARFVDACHAHGIAVVLDVVYNHLGPEGNYLWAFGPYFTDRYKTPWGAAVNFDGPQSDAVRNYVFQNALHWLRDYHLDGLRLDATQTIFDTSARPVLGELAQVVRAFSESDGRPRVLIAESDANDPRLIAPQAEGGCALDAQWADDLHHALHTVLTREDEGYYADYGTLDHLRAALATGYVFEGQYSRAHGRRHGRPHGRTDGAHFVVCAQNHDQIGNRAHGERLSALADFAAQKFAAATILLSPFLPMLFMGEEHGETNPFLYFVDHSDENLRRAVAEGRRKEFEAFSWGRAVPDPCAEESFLRSKVDWSKRSTGRHALLLDWHRELIRLRRSVPELSALRLDRNCVERAGETALVAVRRQSGAGETLLLLHATDKSAPVAFDSRAEGFVKMLDSEAPSWQGEGKAPEALAGEARIDFAPRHVLLYRRKGRT